MQVKKSIIANFWIILFFLWSIPSQCVIYDTIVSKTPLVKKESSTIYISKSKDIFICDDVISNAKIAIVEKEILFKKDNKASIQKKIIFTIERAKQDIKTLKISSLLITKNSDPKKILLSALTLLGMTRSKSKEKDITSVFQKHHACSKFTIKSDFENTSRSYLSLENWLQQMTGLETLSRPPPLIIIY